MRAALICLAACGHPSTAATDGSGPSDATAAAPFATPPGQWTFVDVPGMACGNGTPTGIGVNLSTTSSDVLVYFEGGGACWDAASCFTIKSAIHIQDTYDAALFASEITAFPFDRNDPTLANATFIWVPYCTGDLHAGNHVQTYMQLGQTAMVHHVGAANTQLVIDRVHAALPDAAHVWVSGSSAGGYGATFALNHFADAWPSAEIPLLQDSAPFVSLVANYGLWQSSWSLQFPPGCTGCDADFTKIMTAVVAATPSSRIGLLTYDNDGTIKLFFGYGAGDTLVPATNNLLATHYTDPLHQAFVLAGASHTMLGQLKTITGAGGVKLSDWVHAWASGDAAWTTVH